MKKNLSEKRAFSLAETLILITVSAVVLAVATPFITRTISKIANTGVRFGSNYTGKYEIYSQEFLCPESTVDIKDHAKVKEECYKKTKKQKTSADYITLYRKLSDLEYKKSTGKDPETAYDEEKHILKKSTIYVKIGQINPEKNSDGTITKGSLDGLEYEKGDKYIFEDTNVEYVHKDGVPKVIEGNIVKVCKPDGKEGCKSIPLYHEKGAKISDTNDGNNYFIIKEYNLKRVDIPWITTCIGKTCTGKEATLDEEENIVVPKLPENVNSVTIHAVGGGGGGGSYEDSVFLKNPIRPNTLTGEQRRIITDRLNGAFREAIKRKIGLGLLTPAQKEFAKTLLNKDVVAFNGGGSLQSTTAQIALSVGSSLFPASSLQRDDKWILVNTSDGSITVKVDYRYLAIYPHELLRYTDKLGSHSQLPVKYDMPKWYKTKTGFYAGALVHSGDGAVGATYKSSLNKDHPKLKQLCKCTHSESPSTFSACPDCDTCTDYCDDGKGNSVECGSRACCTHSFPCNNRECYDYKEDNGARNACDSSSIYTCVQCSTYTASQDFGCGGCTGSDKCKDGETRNRSKLVEYKYIGADGGKGKTAWLATKGDNFKGLGIKVMCGKTLNKSTGDNAGGYSTQDMGGATTAYLDEDKMCKNAGQGESCFVNIIDYTYDAIMAVTGGTEGSLCNKYYYSGGGSGSNLNRCDYTFMTLQFNQDGEYEIVESDKKFLSMTKDWLDKATTSCSDKQELKCGKNGEDGVVAVVYRDYNGSGSYKIDDIYKGKTDGFDSAYTSISTEDEKSINNFQYGTDNPPYGISPTEQGIYNHIYFWTIPYAIDSLAYGEGGEPGEYKKTTRNDITGTLYIKLGKGGQVGVGVQKGKDGTSTIVKEVKEGKTINSAIKIIEAKGGAGGGFNKKTDSFDMCFNAVNLSSTGNLNKLADPSYFCKDPSDKNYDKTENEDMKGTFCCMGSQATKSTKDIHSTSIKLSTFDDIRTLTNNSRIIGLGLGRGSEGLGSSTFNEELLGQRFQTNVSTHSGYHGADEGGPSGAPSKIITTLASPKGTSSSDSNYYSNKILMPSSLNAQGGGGAVIIIW